METQQQVITAGQPAQPRQPAYDLDGRLEPGEPQQQEPRQPKPRRPVPRPSGTYDKIGMTLALIGALAAAGVMWWLGAFFTLTAIGIPLGLGWTLAWWLLPLLITGIEIWLMPRAGMGGRLIGLFGVVLAFDVASSWYGVISWAGGRYIELGPGFTIPNGGPVLHVLAVVAGIVMAFYPEKLARLAWAELLKLWR